MGDRALVPCHPKQKAQTWKTIDGAKEALYKKIPDTWKNWYPKAEAKSHYDFYRADEYQVEVIEVEETPVQPTAQQRWDANHPDVIKESKAKYDAQNPILSFRPTPEILEWLEEERWDDETNADLLKRKLEKLRQLECQGY